MKSADASREEATPRFEVPIANITVPANRNVNAPQHVLCRTRSRVC